MIPLLEPRVDEPGPPDPGTAADLTATVPDLRTVPDLTATVPGLRIVPAPSAVPETAMAVAGPVFLDSTGRRRVAVRIATWVLALLCVAALAAIAAGLWPESAQAPAYELEG